MDRNQFDTYSHLDTTAANNPGRVRLERENLHAYPTLHNPSDCYSCSRYAYHYAAERPLLYYREVDEARRDDWRRYAIVFIGGYLIGGLLSGLLVFFLHK